MEDKQLAKIFQPIYQERVNALDMKRMRFAYYTSATTGLNILRGRELWMRAAACMNDYREVDYGIQLLNGAIYGSEIRRSRLRELAQSLHWGESMLEDFLADLNRNENALVTHTYLACISEHTELENERGRLSMWRAYGRKTGVAFVMNVDAILHPESQLPLRVSPVEYLDRSRFEIGLDWMIAHVERYVHALQCEQPERLLKYFHEVLLASLFSLKHPGFVEEREWRIIYHEELGRLPYDLVSVDGVPQVVYKMPICAVGEQPPGLPIEKLLDRIIIGPTQYAEVIAQAFVKALEELGVGDAEARVCMSNIPLRQER